MNFFQTSKLRVIKQVVLAASVLFLVSSVFASAVSAADPVTPSECKARQGTWQKKPDGGGFECVGAQSSVPKAPASQADCAAYKGTWQKKPDGGGFECVGAKDITTEEAQCNTQGGSFSGGTCSVTTDGQDANKCGNEGEFLGLPKWHKYLKKTASTDQLTGKVSCEIQNFCLLANKDNGCTTSSFPLVILAIIEIVLRIGSLVAVAFVVVGGFKFVTSQGEPDGVRSARNTILNALIGLVITLVATPLVSFIANRFGG